LDGGVGAGRVSPTADSPMAQRAQQMVRAAIQ